MTKAQELHLKAQILASRYLQKQAPIPVNLLNIIKSTKLHTSQSSSSFSNPIVVPSISLATNTEVGPTILQKVDDREKRISTKIENRRNELLNFRTDDPALKRKVLLELKMLKLLPIQKKLRQNIVQTMRKQVEKETADLQPDAFRKQRAKFIPVSYSHGESFLLLGGTYIDMPSARNLKLQLLLNSVVNHTRVFKELKEEKMKRWKRVMKELITFYANSERRKQQEKGKNSERFCFQIFKKSIQKNTFRETTKREAVGAQAKR